MGRYLIRWAKARLAKWYDRHAGHCLSGEPVEITRKPDVRCVNRSSFINTVDGSENPNNHLGCRNPVYNEKNYQPQLVSQISESSTVSTGCLSLTIPRSRWFNAWPVLPSYLEVTEHFEKITISPSQQKWSPSRITRYKKLAWVYRVNVWHIYWHSLRILTYPDPSKLDMLRSNDP